MSVLRNLFEKANTKLMSSIDPDNILDKVSTKNVMKMAGGSGVIVAGSVGVSGFSDAFRNTAAGQDNEYRRNYITEQAASSYNLLSGGSMAIGAAGIGASLFGLKGKSRIAGVAASILIGSTGVYSSSLYEQNVRATMQNDYLSNEYGSDVEGSTAPIRINNPFKTAAFGVGAALGLRTLGKMNLMKNVQGIPLIKGAYNTATSTTGALVGGSLVSAKMITAQSNTLEERNRIRGLGY